METWDIIDAATSQPHKPEVLASDDEGRVIVIELPAGESLSEHQVHERAWLLVVGGRRDRRRRAASPSAAAPACSRPSTRTSVTRSRATEDAPPAARALALARRRPPERRRPTIAPAPSQTLLADRDRRRALPAVAARPGIDRVGGRRQLHPRRDLAVTADLDPAAVEQRAVPVDEGPVADRRPVAVVAAKRRLHRHPLPDLAQQLGEDRAERGLVGGGRRVEAVAERSGAADLRSSSASPRKSSPAQQPPLHRPGSAPPSSRRSSANPG